MLFLEYIDLLFVLISSLIIVIVFVKRQRGDKSGGNEQSGNSIFDKLSVWLDKWGGLTAAFVVLFSGWLITLKVTDDQEKYMTQELKSQTIKLVHSFHPEQINRLNFAPQDEQSPIFNRIKNQIRNYSLFSGLKGIYTVRKIGKNFYFGPESFLPGDPMYSSPGSKYLKPSSELKSIFSDPQTIVTDPYEDEFGQFISCFSPVMSISGEKVLMVAGVDIPVDEWSYHKNIVKIFPLSVTLFLLLLILGGFKYVRIKNRKQSFLQINTLRYREGFLVLLAGFVISVYIAKLSSDESLRYKKAVFSQSAASKSTAFARSLDMLRYSVFGMSKLFSVSEKVTKNEFDEYVKQVVEYPFILSAGWIQKLSGNDFYKRYAFPKKESLIPNGEYNASSDTLRYGAILETLNTGFISATSNYFVDGKALVDLFQMTRNDHGKVNGTVILTIDLDALLSSLSFNRITNDKYYNIVLKQIDTPSLRLQNINNSFFDNLSEQKREISYEFLDFFFGKVFSVSITAGPSFYKKFVSSAFWTPFAIGILITLLISSFIMMLINRGLILESEVEKHVSRLHLSEERFKSLFSNMLEGVTFNEMIFDKNHNPVNYRILEVNHAFENLIGLKREEVIGKDAGQLYSEIPSYFEKYKNAVLNNDACVFEAYSKPHKKYFEISVSPLGKSGFAAIFSDITNRRETQLQLKKSEERYRLISENAGDLIWVYDARQEEFNYVSPSVKKLTGFSYEELVGKNLKFILEKESYDGVKSRLPLRINRFGSGEEEMKVQRTQLKIRKKQGGSLPMEFLTTLLLNNEGIVTGILGVGRDISDRLATEEALKESEEKYRLLVENQSDLVVKVDREGYLLYVSPSYCKLFAKSENELLNKKFIPLVHPDDKTSAEEVMKKLATPPYRIMMEQRAMTKDGWKWIAWSETAVLGQDGEIEEIIGVGRDVTERRMAEKALKESRELLERQNEEYATLNEEYLTMNEELTSINEDLSVAIERAEDSEKLKTAFLQNMSHEIRTPLNSIIGFSEMLGMDYLTDADRKDFTTIIVNSSRQLLDLVNDILTISAIETRQDKVNLEPVKVNDLMSELYTVFRPKAKEKGITFKLKKPDTDGNALFVTDELKLRQVLINLLGNALKFTEEGDVEYGYELAREGDFVFYVKDSGVGIPLQMQDRIFDRFMQADNSIKGNYGGTGLGLAICKGHIEMLGGKIWLDSTPGVGSAFYFTLPVIEDVNN